MQRQGILGHERSTGYSMAISWHNAVVNPPFHHSPQHWQFSLKQALVASSLVCLFLFFCVQDVVPMPVWVTVFAGAVNGWTWTDRLTVGFLGGLASLGMIIFFVPYPLWLLLWSAWIGSACGAVAGRTFSGREGARQASVLAALDVGGIIPTSNVDGSAAAMLIRSRCAVSPPRRKKKCDVANRPALPRLGPRVFDTRSARVRFPTASIPVSHLLAGRP